MQKIKKIFLLALINLLLYATVAAQPFTVNVTTNAVPPVNAVINQYVSSGNITSQLLNTAAAGTPAVQVLIYGKIECLSPAPFTISVNPNFASQAPIMLSPGVPVSLIVTQQLEAFGFFNSSNLVASGINLSSVTDAAGNITLPGGTYRICYAARQFDPATGQLGNFISDSNLGCGNFTVISNQPANAVLITTTAIPPVNPFISQAISNGGVIANLQFNNPGGSPTQIKLFGKVECLSPTPFTVSLNPNYQSQSSITVTPGVPQQIAPALQLEAFGGFNQNNLVATGIALSSITDATGNIRLPAGNYRICYAAKYVNAFGAVAGNASDPNLGCGNFNITSSFITIATTAIPPVSPVINLTLGNPAGSIKAIVNYTDQFTPARQVRLYGKIERLSPAPFTLSLNPNYQSQPPVSLTSGVPLQLSPSQVTDAFGNFNDNNLIASGISINELKQNGNYVLPDGTYRLCLAAKNLSGTDASDPNLGCATFIICNKAAAPQFTLPVSNFNLNSDMVTVQKISPVVFTWTPPNTTCGGQPGIITYDFEIHTMLGGQTVTDAINNPPVFQRMQLSSSSFLLDTLLYKDVLQTGRRYVIRVKANIAPGSFLQIENNGYSRIEAFQYGDTAKQNNPPVTINDGNNNNNQPPNNNNNQPPQINAVGGDCGIKPPSNTIVIAASVTLDNTTPIKIGEFTLKPTKKLTRNSDDTYKGEGTIDWTPVTSLGINNVASIGVAKLKVAFDKLKINTDKVVFDGEVVTQTDPGVFNNESFSKFQDFTKKTGTQLDKLAGDVEGFINKNPEARLISNLTGNTPVDLPLGLNDKDIGGAKATFAIMSIVFSPKGATASVLFDVNIEEANGWLTLAGSDFCIHPQGVSFSQGTLFLPNDRDFNLGSGKDAFNIKFKGCPSADSTNGTYVHWENNKLTDIVAHAEIAFPQNTFVPEDDKGEITGGSVIAKIMFRFKEWNNWVAGIEMPHFQIKDVKGLSFQPSVIFYDHSAKINPPAFSYPSSWKGKKDNSFMGLYVKQFDVLLPEDFKTFNQKKDERTSFKASDLILDDNGITTYIQGKNIIDISTGNMGGWGYSLNNIEVQVTNTTFEKGKMEGQFLLPVSKTPLDYSGDLHLGKDSVNYAFVIKPSAKMSWDIWKASVELKPNSYIEVKKDSLGAAVTALMYGDVSIILSDGAPSLKFEAIKFDSLGISNRNIKTKKKEFWMSPGVWAFASPQKSVAGFPVNLDGILPYVEMKSEIEAGLNFKLSMGIGGKDKTIIGASAKLALYGAMKFSLDDFRPNFTVSAGIRADSVRLFGDAGPLKVDGWLAFYKKDNLYGDGLKGHVQATFPMIKIEATAQFGNVNDFNYWFIDACAQFGTPIPVVGPIGINGFGGGAYYNMKLQNEPPQDNEMKPKSIANNNTPGSSMSGITFVPNEGSFGLRATVMVCMVTGAGPKAMNAKITMGAEMKNGAFQNLNLTGDVYVFTNPPENDRAIVKGHVEIVYNIPEEKFSLNALVLANFSAAKLTVPINLYTGPDGWYFKVGDPWAQKVTLTFPEAKTSFYHYNVGASAYFVVGSLINPQLPDLPVQVSNLLGTTSDPNTQSFISELNKTPGSGMMFGAEVHGSLGFNVAIIYADAEAILGFDMMLKHFDALTCGGGKSAGWENWYALGQLYAYLKLDVGLNIDVWFYSGKISLAKFEAGALLRGGLPNPTWMEGAVAIKGEVLGGLVKVDTKAHFSIGDKCYPDPDPLKDVKIISDYGPKGNKESVFVYPYGASNVGLDKNYEISVPPTQSHPDGEVRLYQFKIKSFRLLKDGTTPVESTNLEYSNDNNTVTLKRSKILDAYTNYTGEIQCYAIQYQDGKGWTNPRNDKTGNDEPVEETSTFSFKTGPKPDYIPDENISFSYPVNRQRYVLMNEMNGKGIIHLDQAQDNILSGDGKGLYAVRSYKVYFIAAGTTDTIKTDFTWNEQTLNIEYNLPAALKNNTVYRVELWSFEKSGILIAAPSFLKTQTKMSAMNINGIDIQQKEVKVVSAALKILKPIYTMYYRTSEFNTLGEKINAMGNWSAAKKNNALNITNDAMATEHFDEFETKGFVSPNGKNWYAPLLDVNIAWDNNQQNDRFANDNIYANAFMFNFKQVTTEFGMNWLRDYRKPVNTIDLNKLYSDKPLSPSETGESVPPSNTPKVSSGGSMMMSLPLNNVNKNQSVAFNFGYQTIVWNREQYLLADYKLMKDFANAVSLNAGAFYGWSSSYTENYLSKLGGNVDFSYNNLGGYTTMPWNKFYYLYTDSKYMNTINSLKNLLFTPYPKGNRNMQFRYRAGNMAGTSLNKMFSY